MTQSDPTQAVRMLASHVLETLSDAEFHELYDAINEGKDPHKLSGYRKARALFVGQPPEGAIVLTEILLEAFADEARRRVPWVD